MMSSLVASSALCSRAVATRTRSIGSWRIADEIAHGLRQLGRVTAYPPQPGVRVEYDHPVIFQSCKSIAGATTSPVIRSAESSGGGVRAPAALSGSRTRKMASTLACGGSGGTAPSRPFSSVSSNTLCACIDWSVARGLVTAQIPGAGRPQPRNSRDPLGTRSRRWSGA
jgi:hypothetical protein